MAMNISARVMPDFGIQFPRSFTAFFFFFSFFQLIVLVLQPPHFLLCASVSLLFINLVCSC